MLISIVRIHTEDSFSLLLHIFPSKVLMLTRPFSIAFLTKTFSPASAFGEFSGSGVVIIFFVCHQGLL